MENEEKVLNPQESLRIIRETIDLAKSGPRENGFHFLLWGWLVVLTCLADYCLDAIAHYPQHHLIWLGMVVIGIPAALLYEWRRDKKQVQGKNVIRDWYGRVWLAFAISLFIAIVLTVQAHLSPIPFILILVGFATFVSGSLLRFPPLLFGAVAMWAGAALCLATGYREHLLIQAAATVVGYLIPGYLLNRNARNTHV